MVSTDYEDIPADVIKYDKGIILDTLGVLMAGSSAPACKEIVELVRDMGGKPESSILVYGGKVPSMMATLANATMAQARDFDDTHDEAILHSHSSVLTTALAAAEATGASGKRLLTGVILGAEVECRIGVAIRTPLAFTRTGTLGYFGATAAAGKILGLSEEELLNAFGIMYSQVSTNLQPVVDGALVKRMHPGFCREGRFTIVLPCSKGNYRVQRSLGRAVCVPEPVRTRCVRSQPYYRWIGKALRGEKIEY